MPYLHATLGASGGFFRSEAAIVSGEAAIVILTRGDRDPGRMTIAASPLTIAASLRKKNPLAPRVSSCMKTQQCLLQTTRELSETEEDLDLWLRSIEEAVSLRVSKAEKNPGRPYFVCRDRECRDRGCRFFQWADVELSMKNKRKQAKR